MSKNGLNHKVWVLICDGQKALLTENEGDAAAPNLKIRQTFGYSDLPTHEQGSDKPGRAFADVGQRRSATESTDFHELAKEDFLKMLAAHLERGVSDHQIKSLILVAPPHALGILRNAIPSSVRKIVQHEIEKDYAHMPVYEIERHVMHQLAGE